LQKSSHNKTRRFPRKTKEFTDVPSLSKIVFASDNPGKIREVADIFADLDIAIVPQKEFAIEAVEETGTTFADNALLKARHASAQSGLPAMADDSGIVVDALGGRPGVRSARYAGQDATDEQNLDKLLAELAEVPDGRRAAGFHCAAVLVFPDSDGAPLAVEAVWRGDILRERKGSGGFGYDPVFLDPSAGKTGAQMTREEKNRVSHRGKAFRELKNLLLQRQPLNQ
jgi:XTP/dITP diphosphohydrolase